MRALLAVLGLAVLLVVGVVAYAVIAYAVQGGPTPSCGCGGNPYPPRSSP